MKKLAIVGAGKTTRHTAPFGDASFDIWGIHKHAMAPWMERCDAGIEVHGEQKIKASCSIGISNDEYLEWLYTTDTLIYTVHLSGSENFKPYPLEEIKNDLLGRISVMGKSINNFNSSIDYALALGIYRGYKEIEMYGMPMRMGEEYTHQRPGLAFWAGLATGRGVKINMMYENDLFDRPLYAGDK